MISKNEVYVVLDTEKKVKKVNAVLEMFGENIYERTKERLDKCLVDKYYVNIIFDNEEWCGSHVNGASTYKTKVSPKELRNILAVEKLKEGDVVIFKNGLKGKIVGFNGDSEIIVNDEDKDNVTCLIRDFIRYATEEEKQLLNPKKELEVGKWYIFDGHKVKSKPLMLIKENTIDCVIFHGFNFLGDWTDNDSYTKRDLELYGYREATHEEVEQALIKDAKKRGLVNGVRINDIYNSEEYATISSSKLDYEICPAAPDEFGMCLRDSLGNILFSEKLGKWAEIIKTEPTIEESVQIGDWVSYKSGDIPKVSKVTETNLKHYSKAYCKRIKNKELIEKLNNL